MTLPISPGRRGFLGSLAALAALPALAHDGHEHPLPPTLPGDSIYRIGATLQDQNGRSFELASMAGAPVLASMFYTSCDMVCPMIFETIHATLRAMPAAERKATRVLMVSFDPARDSVEVLKKTAEARGCDAQWVLARGDEATARRVAAALGIQYRRLSNGEFNHSSVLELLDGSGRVVARSGKLGAADPAILAASHKLA
jgi:protein SCO1/2